MTALTQGPLEQSHSFIETARGMGVGGWEWDFVFKGDRVSVGDDEMHNVNALSTTELYT